MLTYKEIKKQVGEVLQGAQKHARRKKMTGEETEMVGLIAILAKIAIETTATRVLLEELAQAKL